MKKREKIGLKGKKIITVAMTVLMSTVTFVTFGSYVYNLKNTRDTVQNIVEDDKIGSQIIETKKADFKKLDENQFELNTETKTISFSEDIKSGSVCVSCCSDGPTASDKWQTVKENDVIQLKELDDEKISNVNVYYMSNTSLMSPQANTNGTAELMLRDYNLIGGMNVYYAIGAKRSSNTKYTADLITSITFVNNVNVPTEAEASWDASYTNGDNEIIAWVIPNVTDDTKYDLYIGADNKKIIAPTDSGKLFQEYTNCTTINNLTMLDTSQVRRMDYMFYDCNSLTSLNVSNFDTSQVGRMGSMFAYCKSLISLDLTSFDTSNVTDMHYMFYGCKSLTSLAVSNFDTSKVTDMSCMFYDCSSLPSLDVSNFDTSIVRDMSFMFRGCSSLPSLDVSNFDTSNVTNMQAMFSICSNLPSLDVSNFDTSKVTNMGGIFQTCRNLQSLDVSKFNTSNVRDMGAMFSNCSSLPSLNVSNFNTSNVRDMRAMFSNCSSLPSLNVSNFNTSNVTNMSNMFQNCSSLPSLNVSNFDTSNVTDMGAMFSSCSNLPSLNVSNFNTSNVTNMSNMFQNCSSLANLNVSNFDTSNVTNMKAMFSGCNNLPSLDVSNFDTSNVTNMFEMFYNCKNLTSINIGANFDKLTGSRMFYSCSNLKAIITPRTSIMTLNADATISTGLKLLPKIVLYVSNVDVETTFESDANYANIFGADRIKPILELVGDNPAKVLAGSTYVDAGVTVAGMTQNATDTTYTPYGYTVSGPVIKKNGTVVSSVDTSTVGSIYTYTYTIKDSANVVGMSVTRTVNVTSVPTLMRRETANSQYYAIGAYRADNSTTYTADKIKTITLLNTQEAPENYIATWDASYTKGDNTVTAWLVTNAEDNTMYDLYLGAEGKIYAPKDSGYLFRDYKKCVEINGINNLDTSNVTDMSQMFYFCEALVDLDASNFDTSQVTDMRYMFSNCSSLKSLNVSNLDTSNVTDMYYMFNSCKKLTSLDVSNFDTSKVTRMYGMFSSCNSLTTLDLSNFDTSNVTSMSSMFRNCGSLTSLNVSGFNTSKVTDMSYMFSGCRSLPSLDVRNFDTSKVTTMSGMFESCSNLTNLDVSNFDTSNVTSMHSMFNLCWRLTSLDVSNFDTSNVTTMGNMFRRCPNLTSLNLSNFDTSNVTTMGCMFWGCDSLTSIDVSNFDTRNVKSMWCMFSYCSSLPSLELSNFDTSKVTDMGEMFKSCSSLTSLKLGQNFDKLTGAVMFDGCSKLKAIITPRDSIMTLNDNATTSTGLKTLTNAILYVPSTTAEATFESDTNYADIFGADRIKPILELVGDNPIEIAKGTTYVDSGVTVAGMDKNADGTTYTPYGYTVSVTGLPVDTSTNEPKVITYTIKDSDGVSGMSVTRTVNMAREDITPTVNMENYTYGGTKSTPTVTGNLGNGAVTYYYNTTNSNANGTLWSTVTSSTSLDAGTYYMYAVIDETANYNGATTPAKAFVINKANGYITLSEETGTVPYGSANKTFTVTSHHGGILTATQTTSTGVAVSVSGTTVTISSMSSVAAGTEIVIKVTSAETTNYATASADYTLTIGKTNITPTVNMKNYAYGGTLSEPSVTGNLGNGTVTYYYNTTNSNSNGTLWSTVTSSTSLNAGTYYMYAVITETSNYFGATTPAKEFTIETLPVSGSVTIGGVPMVNKTLAAMVSIDPEDCSLSYKWYISDTQTTSSGTLVYTSTTDNTLLVTSNMLEKYVYVEVTASKANYTTTVFKNVTGIRVRSDDGSKDIMEAIRYVIVEDILPILMNESMEDVYNYGYILGNSTISQRRKDIISISFRNTSIPTSDSVTAWDVSYNKDGSVIAWLTENENYEGMYNLNIGGNRSVIAVSGYCLFAKYPNLASIDGFDIFDTSRVTSMQSMFESSGKLTNLNLSSFDTRNVTNMSYMFSECTFLSNLNISNWNTSKVSNMQSMFERCGGFTTIDLSALNTSHVTDISSMFRECTRITSINLNNFDTAQVKNMGHLFDGCINLNDIKMGINTSNVRDMNNMFNKCAKLTSLNLESFNTGLVTDMNNMFNGCEKITSFDLSGFNTINVQNMSGMFKDCTNLTALDLRTFTTKESTIMDEMFSNDSRLKTMVIGNTFNAVVGNNMFLNCGSLKAIITTKSISSPSNAFKLSAGITSIDNFKSCVLYVPNVESEKNYEKATNFDTVLGNDRIRPILELLGKEKIYVKNGDPYVDAGVTVAGFNSNEAINYMQYGYKLVTTGIPANTLTNGIYTITYTLSDKDDKVVMVLERIVYVFDGAILMEREDVGYAIGAKRAGKVTYTSNKIRNIYISDLNEQTVPSKYVDSWDVSSAQNESVMAYVVNNAWDNGRYDLYICGVDKVIAPENSKDLFANYTNCSSISGFDALSTRDVKNMNGMFKDNLLITSLDLSKFATSKVTDMSGMFSGMKKATSLDLKAFDTSNVLDMSFMFNGMEVLNTLDISTFTTNKVTNMTSMFNGLKVLTSLDVTKFDTSNVTSFESMFRDCQMITSLDVSKFVTSNAQNFYAMFENCNKVTTLNVSNFDTSKAKNLASMFNGCSSITNLDVSKFRFDSLDFATYSETATISGVSVPRNDLYGMFMECEKLANLDLTAWDTSSVTNMAYMLADCSSITRMNLTNFDTTKVTEAQHLASMFENANKLESILLGIKFNNLNSSNMFDGCDALKVIIARSTEPAPLALDVGLITLNDAILYVPNKAAESDYESNTNYLQVFGVDRIKPILALVGDEVVEVVRTGTYIEKGVSVAGFEEANKLKYLWYGYDADNIMVTKDGVTVAKVDTMVVGEYEITYTLKYTDLAGNVSDIDSIKRIVRVTETDINSDNITVSIPDETRIYNGKEHTPEVTVVEKDKETGVETTLVLNKDYEVSYANNIDAGTATITIKGIGPYFGSRTLEFEILKRKITITLDDATKVYDGTALTSNKFTLTDGTLVEGQKINVEDVVADGSQTEAGSSDNNIVSIIVRDSSNVDVTKNYDITSIKGTLTVTKAEQDISFDIDVSGKIVIVKGNTYTFSYTYTGTSDVVGSTSDEHIATITKSGNAFTLLGVEVGNCKAIITVKESSNFKEKNVEIEVEVIDAYYSVSDGSKTTYYNKLEDAIKENATVKVLKDAKDTSTNVSIDKNINLDLGGYDIVINAPITIVDGGILIISATTGSGIKSSSETAITNNGTLVIGDSSKNIVDAPRIEGGKYAINGKFTFNDGVLAGSNEPPYTGGTVTIERVFYEIVTEPRNGMYESKLRGETNPPEITIIPDITEKTNKNVTLTVIVTDSQSGVKKVTYTVDGKTYDLDIDSNGEGTIVATENNKYLITAEDNFGNIATKEYVVSNIDRNAGNVTNVDIDGEVADNVTVILKNITVDKDDITEVLFANTNKTVSENDENWIPYYEDMEAPHVLDGSTGNGVKTIYAWAKDEAGNISSKPYVFEITLKTKLIGGTTNMAKFTIAGFDKNYKNSKLGASNITFTASNVNINPAEKSMEKVTSGYASGSLVGDKFNLMIKDAKGVGRIIINIAADTLYDKAGNTNDLVVLDTDIYIDTAAPVITIESGRIVVKDNEGNLLGVTVNGKLVRKSEGDCGLAVKGDVIKAYDKAGNVATYIAE